MRGERGSFNGCVCGWDGLYSEMLKSKSDENHSKYFCPDCGLLLVEHSNGNWYVSNRMTNSKSFSLWLKRLAHNETVPALLIAMFVGYAICKWLFSEQPELLQLPAVFGFLFYVGATFSVYLDLLLCYICYEKLKSRKRKGESHGKRRN